MTTISLWGALFAFFTIGEVLTPTGLLGGLMILGGCVLGNLSPGKPKQKSEPTTNAKLEAEEMQNMV